MLDLAANKSDHGRDVTEFVLALRAALQDTPPEAKAFEIGVQAGGSALFTMWHLWKEAKGRAMLTLDASANPDLLREYSRRWDVPWEHVQAPQQEWIPAHIGTHQYGFIYHDGGHGDAHVLPEVPILARDMVPGAMLAIDDLNQCSKVPDFTEYGLRRVEGLTPRERTDIGCGTHIGFWHKVA